MTQGLQVLENKNFEFSKKELEIIKQVIAEQFTAEQCMQWVEAYKDQEDVLFYILLKMCSSKYFIDCKSKICRIHNISEKRLEVLKVLVKSILTLQCNVFNPNECRFQWTCMLGEIINNLDSVSKEEIKQFALLPESFSWLTAQVNLAKYFINKKIDTKNNNDRISFLESCICACVTKSAREDMVIELLSRDRKFLCDILIYHKNTSFKHQFGDRFPQLLMTLLQDADRNEMIIILRIFKQYFGEEFATCVLEILPILFTLVNKSSLIFKEIEIIIETLYNLETKKSSEIMAQLFKYVPDELKADCVRKIFSYSL